MNNHDLPEGFKMTELGPLPEEWEVVRLGEVVSAFSGLWGEDAKSVPGKVLVRVIRVSDITKENLVNYLSAPTRMITQKQFHKYRLMRSDILVVKSSGSKTRVISGRCAYFEPESDSVPFIPSNFILALRSKTEMVHSRFLWFYLLTEESQARVHQMTEGSTYPNLKVSEYLTLPIPLPPLPEQRAIAHVLRTVQRAKEATEKVIAATRELKKSLMRHLFTYGPVPVDQVDQVRLKETEIGPVPEHWEVVRLGEVAEYMKAGGTPSRQEPRYWEGDIPFVRIEDMTSCGLYLSSTKETISLEGLENSSAWLVPPGSLLLSMYATIGETAVNMIPVATNQAILALIPKPIFYAEFGAYLLKYHASRLVQYNVQSTQKNVNKGIVEQFPIPLPPLPEQQAIAEILRAVDRKLEAEERRKAALEVVFKTLLHHLMTGKIRLPRPFIAQFDQEAHHAL